MDAPQTKQKTKKKMKTKSEKKVFQVKSDFHPDGAVSAWFKLSGLWKDIW